MEDGMETPLKIRNKTTTAAAAKLLQLCPTLATPWTAAHQAPPSMGFSRQKYGVGCHCLLRKPPHDPAIPPLGIYPEETKTEKDTCIPLFIATLFTIGRTWKQPRCPLADEWIKKCGTYTQGNITQP